LTTDTEEERKLKLAEKRKKKKKAQQERLKQKSDQEKHQSEQMQAEKKKLDAERELKTIESLRVKKLEGMSQRDRLALAADSRLAKKQCSYCGSLLTGVPFERFQYLYCSINCVQQHRDSAHL
jgi:hypothetical protein